MPFKSQRAALILSPEVRQKLQFLNNARTQPAQLVDRSGILLAYAEGDTVSSIARKMHTNRPKVERCLKKALEIGVEASLQDLPGRGKKPLFSEEARAWVVSLACQKPKDLGYSYELWTTRLLATHIRRHCEEAGHPLLIKLSRGTVSKILSKNQVRPHKISYYLERRDPEFEAKMAQVLCIYHEVKTLSASGQGDDQRITVLSYDEKPGIQAIGTTAPDLPPVPGQYKNLSRDHEYIRHGTLSLLAGIDLFSGKVIGLVADRHRSREFIQWLQMLDKEYPTSIRIRLILDNHSAHISKETRQYLATTPNRFEFIFTPKHGSWLNLIESFFGKMARSMLRGIRVASKEELKKRIEQYLSEVNQSPVIYRWKYGLDSLSVV